MNCEQQGNKSTVTNIGNYVKMNKTNTTQSKNSLILVLFHTHLRNSPTFYKTCCRIWTTKPFAVTWQG